MVWQFLLWLCLALLAGVVLVVVLPIHVKCLWQSDPAKQASVLLRPLGGVFPAISVYDSTRRTRPKRRKRAEKRRKDRDRRQFRLRRVDLSDVADLLDRIIYAFHIERLHVDAEFGLGDPADTGQLYGQLTPFIHASGLHLDLRPNFAEICLRGTALLQFRFTLLGLIWPLIRFGWRVMGPGR